MKINIEAAEAPESKGMKIITLVTQVSQCRTSETTRGRADTNQRSRRYPWWWEQRWPGGWSHPAGPRWWWCGGSSWSLCWGTWGGWRMYGSVQKETGGLTSSAPWGFQLLDVLTVSCQPRFWGFCQHYVCVELMDLKLQESENRNCSLPMVPGAWGSRGKDLAWMIPSGWFSRWMYFCWCLRGRALQELWGWRQPEQPDGPPAEQHRSCRSWNMYAAAQLPHVLRRKKQTSIQLS